MTIICYSNSCFGDINAVAIVIVTMVTLHVIAIVNYMLLLIIWLLVFCDFIGTNAFEIYKSFIEIYEYIWNEDIVYFDIVFNKFGIAMAINCFASKYL